MFLTQDNQDYQLWTPGYKMIQTQAMRIISYYRLVTLVKDGCQVKVEEQWMSPEIASIWLKVSKRGGTVNLWYIQRT